MKIEAKVQISKIEHWSTNWSNKNDKANELKKLERDMRMAIFEMCGINLYDISIELVVSD